MRFPIFGSTNDAPASGTRFAYLTQTGLEDWSNVEANRQIPLSEDVIITDFKVILDTAPGSGKSRNFVIRQNGADTGVTLTISDTATEAKFTGSVNFSANDLVNVATTGTNTPDAPGNIYWYMWMVTNGNKCFIMGMADANPSATVTHYTNPFGSSSTITNVVNQDMPIPTGGTITKMAVALSVAPGAGKSRATSVRLNNTSDVLTTTISDTAKTGTATGSQALVAGDDIVMKMVPSGTPANARPGWCITFEPTTSGESIMAYGAGTPLPTSGDAYDQTQGVGSDNVWGATETSVFLKPPAVTIKKLQVRLSNIPAGTTRTFTLRDNGSDTALAVTITGGGAVTGNDTTHTVTHTADQTVSMKASLTGAPGAASVHYSMVLLSTQPITTSTSSFFLMF